MTYTEILNLPNYRQVVVFSFSGVTNCLVLLQVFRQSSGGWKSLVFLDEPEKFNEVVMETARAHRTQNGTSQDTHTHTMKSS